MHILGKHSTTELHSQLSLLSILRQGYIKSPKLIFNSLYEAALIFRSSCLRLLTWPIYPQLSSNCLSYRVLNFTF